MLDLSWQDNHITRLKYAIWMPTIYNWIFWMVLSLSLAEDITLLRWIRLGLTIKSVSSHTIVCIPNQREEFWEYWVEDFFSDESCKNLAQLTTAVCIFVLGPGHVLLAKLHQWNECFKREKGHSKPVWQNWLNRIFKIRAVSISNQFYLSGIQFWSLYKFVWSLRCWTWNCHIR